VAEDPGLSIKSKIVCSSCSSLINYSDEVWMLRVVQPQVLNGTLLYHDLLDDDGLYKYQPLFFEFECWEAIESELEEFFEENCFCSTDEESLSIIECDICGSDIREWEVMGVAQFGELHRSQRSPDGTSGSSFAYMGTDHHVCISCLCHLDGGDNVLWGDDVEVLPGRWACRGGLFERCWRQPECDCQRLQREYKEQGADPTWGAGGIKEWPTIRRT
jgi:hypothetical protein